MADEFVLAAIELLNGLLEIAYAAVNQFCRAARGPRSKIGALDEGRAEPARGCVDGDPRAGRAAADNEEVEPAAFQPLDGFCTLLARFRSGLARTALQTSLTRAA